MTAAIYLKRSGVSCAIFESSMPGGQIVANDKIENYPGFSIVSGTTPLNSSRIFLHISTISFDFVL